MVKLTFLSLVSKNVITSKNNNFSLDLSTLTVEDIHALTEKISFFAVAYVWNHDST